MKRLNKLFIALASIFSVAAILPLSACSSGKMHTLTMINENEEGGSLTGDGTYKAGSLVSISYTANKNYKFEHWDIDGETIKIANRTYTFKMPNKDIVVKGNFVLKQYEVSVRYKEHVTIIGEGKYDVGSEVTLTAIPDEGYTFFSWNSDDKETLSYDPVYTFVMPSKNIVLRVDVIRQSN